MYFFVAASFLAFIGCYLLAVFVYFKGLSGPKRDSFIPTAIFAGTWCLFPALKLLSFSPIILRAVYIAGLFTGPAFLKFGLTMAEVQSKKIEKSIIKISYLIAFTFIPFLFTSLIIRDVIYEDIHLSLIPGILYPIFILFFVSVCSFSFLRLMLVYKASQGLRKNQLKYVFLAYFVAFLSALIHFGGAYGVKEFFPHDVLVLATVMILAYTTLKYQLMDVKIALSRFSIFIFVYALVLGVPFWVGLTFLGMGHWIIPTSIAIVLASVGPFIYLFLQRRAEEHLLQEDIQVQNLLVKASHEMTGIHTLENLNTFVVSLVVKSLDLDHAGIFVFDKSDARYTLLSDQEEKDCLKEDDPAVGYIQGRILPILLEEIKLQIESEKTETLDAIYKMMKERSFQVIVPIHMNNVLSGFIGLGRRTTNEPYSKGMLNALSILSNQTAFAIENCRYIKEENERMEVEGAMERMVSLDHMASSMAHEIDNPQSTISTQADFLVEVLEGDLRVKIPPEIWEIVKSGLQSIQESSKRVSAMIKVILDYSRKGSGELKPIKLYPALESFDKLIYPELKNNDFLVINKEIESNLPCILGDKILIEEILINFARNAIHAVKYIDKEKILKLKVSKKDDKVIRIEFSDNGYGIEKKLIQDVFLASVTTKGSVEGTGLGLYRVRKVVEKMNGKVWAESEGKGKGATLIAELPILRDKFDDIVEDSENDDSPPDSKIVF